MSYPRKHRWFHRLALGLALASVMFAGRASVVLATIDPGTAAGDDPYLTDVYVRPGESLGGPRRRAGRAAPRTQVQGHERQGRHASGHRADAADLDGPGRGRAAPRTQIQGHERQGRHASGHRADAADPGLDRDAAAPRPALKSKDTSVKADTQADIERMRRIWTDRD